AAQIPVSASHRGRLAILTAACSAYSTSQSRMVGVFGPVRGATGLPSGPIAAACLGSPGATGSEAAADGGRSSPPLRPQPARPSAAISAPTTAILARARLDD